jgi:hypothetical protein
MKATELRIGNLVNYDTAEGDVLPNVIDWQDLKWLSEDEQGFNLVHNPIPLTEEWFLNLRFISFKRGHLYYENNGFCILYAYGKFHYSPSQSITIGREIKYIHELQNWCFLLTGEELTLSK